MIKNQIKHVFFDLDHTLWDFDKNSALTFKKIFNIHNIEVSFEDFIEAYEPINFNYWKLYREEKISKSKLRYGRLRDAFDAINYVPKDEIIHKLSEAYIEYLTTINYLFDGTIEVLEYLNNLYELHIITNGFKEAQQRKLDNSKIAGYFRTVTNSEMVGVKKPNPKIFNYALDLAQAAPDESMMIGDNLEADIQGAHNAGMSAIWFDYKNENLQYQDKRVTHLLDLKTLL